MSNLYAIASRDAPGTEATRAEHRDAHFSHVETMMNKVTLAGPLKDADSGFTGSLVPLYADSEAEARTIRESDPHFKAGMWTDVRIDAFIAAAGTMVGGKTW